MAAPEEPIVAPGREPAFGLELLHFADSVGSASSIGDLARRFDVVFRPLFGMPMRGLYVIEPWTGEYELIAGRRTRERFLPGPNRAGGKRSRRTALAPEPHAAPRLQPRADADSGGNA
jgi:hypothetical protein